MVEKSQEDTSNGRGLKLYLASPIQTYHTPRYDRMVQLVEAIFPNVEVHCARGMYGSSDDWRIRWPLEKFVYDLAVFFTDEQGFIGRGVYRECNDLRHLARDVWWLRDDGRIVPDWEFELYHGGIDWKRFARVK